MRQKALIISLFLIFGLVLSNFLTISSLSLAKEIKSTFIEEEDLGKEIEGPFSKDGRTVSFEKGVFKWKPSMFKEKFTSFVESTPGNFLKVAAYYSPFLILLLVITYFLRKRYKKKYKRNSKNNNRFEIEVAQKQATVLENKDEIDVVPITKKSRIATKIQLNETRRLLQKWEAGLDNQKMKREAETINEWFERINGPIEIIPIYERVRYGEKNCTEDELRFIQNTLKL